MHKSLHQQGHCDGSPFDNRRLPTDEVDGLEYPDTYVMQQAYNEIRSRDIPAHIPQIPL